MVGVEIRVCVGIAAGVRVLQRGHALSDLLRQHGELISDAGRGGEEVDDVDVAAALLGDSYPYVSCVSRSSKISAMTPSWSR
jgi:hypothetical protein